MFCPNCHTYIDNDDSTKFCKRCGNEIDKSEKKRKYSTFKPSINKFNSTFKSTMKSSIKTTSHFNSQIKNKINQSNDITDISQVNTIGMTHDEQAAYSRQYSGLNKDPRLTHDEQAVYSRQYSGLNKDPRLTHDEQATYSRQYSGLNKDPRLTHEQQATYSRQYSNLNKNPNKSHDEQYNYNVKYSFTNKDIILSDNDYRKYYINENANEIMKGKFSLPALLFGPIYLIYRKMYVLGIALQTLLFIILLNFGEDVANGFQLVLNIIIANKANIWYLNHVNQKVKAIKNNNPDKSTSEIANICKQEGGTIPLKKFFAILIIVYIVYNAIIQIYEFYTNEYKQIEENKNTQYINEQIPTQETNENIPSQEIRIVKNIKDYQYKIPTELELKVDYDNVQSYTYKDINTNCVFLIRSEPNNIHPTEFLNNQNNNYSFDLNATSINQKNYNNITWYYNSVQISNQKIYTYATKDNQTQTIYSLTTTIYNSNNNTCQIYSEELLESFKERY